MNTESVKLVEQAVKVCGTQAKLARRLDCDQGIVSRWINGWRKPRRYYEKQLIEIVSAARAEKEDAK